MPILVKAGDTAPTVQATLLDAANQPVDLVGASCRFIMVNADTRDPKISSPGLVRQNGSGTDGSKGAVEYLWKPGDTNPAGNYFAEFEVTFSDGSVQTFPTEGYISAKIVDDLGGLV